MLAYFHLWSQAVRFWTLEVEVDMCALVSQSSVDKNRIRIGIGIDHIPEPVDTDDKDKPPPQADL